MFCFSLVQYTRQIYQEVTHSKSMTNSTLIRLALKSRVQAPELIFYRRKIDGGDQCPYSQPVK
jgi:hypothetical protein